jgi:glycosyltransferase involved in cell wall biosynthesis
MQHLEGRDIVCFANDWSGDPLSKKHVMRRLARRNRVLWINSLGNRAPHARARDFERMFKKLSRAASGLENVEPNIWVLSPLAVPSYSSAWARRLNQLIVGTTVRRAMRRLGFVRPIVYTFVPASAWVAGQLGAERVVYHCVDEFAAFDGAGASIARLEEELVRASDLVIACSEPLYQRKRPFNRNTVLIRHGVEHAHFARALDAATPVPARVAHLPRPIIGFHGLVAEWVDLAAMEAVAHALPSASLVIVGDLHTPEHEALARLHALENVHFIGRRPYDELPGYCKAFDVALLPFKKSVLTECASPLKLREYLAAGLPVVATDIPEAAALAQQVNGVYLASGPGATVARVIDALRDGPGPSRARAQAMACESWDAKVEEIEERLLHL